MEARENPALVFGLVDGATQSLIRFDTNFPNVLQDTIPITGLNGDTLVGIDYRPGTNQLYGVAASSKLYLLGTDGVASQIGSAPFTPALDGTAFGVDFNPAVDKLRVVSNTGQNLRLDPTTGGVINGTADPTLSYDPTAFNTGKAEPVTPPAPNIVATAYLTRRPGATPGTFVTTQYVIDANLDILATQGQRDGITAPNTPPGSGSPNSGVLFPVSTNLLGFDFDDRSAFEILNGSDTAIATRVTEAGTALYSIDLGSGQATAIGVVPGLALRGLAEVPFAPGAGTVQLLVESNAFDPNRLPLEVIVSRTDGGTGEITVDFATMNGTGENAALANLDYIPMTGTITFAQGQQTQAITLMLPETIIPGPERRFTLMLSNPGGGATLGSSTTTEITIPAVARILGSTEFPGPIPALVNASTETGPTITPAPIPNRFLAIGAGVGGGPVVNVYDAVTGIPLYNFNAFEPSFRGGVTVAVGDVNNDGVDDIIVGTGFGGGPRVFVFDGQTKATLANFFAYEESFRGGVNVAVGDINGDGFADILVGSGVGGGPRVRVFDGSQLTPTGTPSVLTEFFAYEESFRGGVNVAAGAFNGNAFDSIVAGSGVGGGPRVRIFELDGVSVVPVADFAVGADALRFGVNVAVGNVTGSENVVLTGFGTGSDVVGLFRFNGSPITSFPAFDQATNGVRLAVNDFLLDGNPEIIAASGNGGEALLPIIRLTPATNGSFTPQTLSTIQAFPAGFTGGVYVG